VLDEDLAVVSEANAFLRHMRFGRDGSELTSRSYAGGIALFLRWCARSGRHWHAGVEHLGLFITWLGHAGGQVSGVDAGPGGQVLAGPGREPVRGAGRVNAVLCAVRGFVAHAVSSGQASAQLLGLIYELAEERDLPEQARGEDAWMGWRMRARHRLREPETTVDRAGDEEIVALAPHLLHPLTFHQQPPNCANTENSTSTAGLTPRESAPPRPRPTTTRRVRKQSRSTTSPSATHPPARRTDQRISAGRMTESRFSAPTRCTSSRACSLRCGRPGWWG
jgi:hypothetical protein